MQELKYKNHIIYFEDFKYQNSQELQKFINNKTFEHILDKFSFAVILVLGWDWTMLSAINKYLDFQNPFLWINFWTKWFLLNNINFVNDKTFEVLDYPILETQICIWETKKTIFSFNELDIRSGNWRLLTLDISISNSKSISISWDWLIISTPSGSTWYNSSLGWPILPHNINAFILTPKAPWRPKWQTPILLSDEKNISISNSWRKNLLELYSDSNLFYSWDSIDVKLKISKSKKCVKIIVFWSYKEIWEDKVLIEQWFNI